jgi:hypothetical protein
VASLQSRLKAQKEGNDVILRRVMIEHLVKEPFAGVVVHNG